MIKTSLMNWYWRRKSSVVPRGTLACTSGQCNGRQWHWQKWLEREGRGTEQVKTTLFRSGFDRVTWHSTCTKIKPQWIIFAKVCREPDGQFQLYRSNVFFGRCVDHCFSENMASQPCHSHDSRWWVLRTLFYNDCGPITVNEQWHSANSIYSITVKVRNLDSNWTKWATMEAWVSIIENNGRHNESGNEPAHIWCLLRQLITIKTIRAHIST